MEFVQDKVTKPSTGTSSPEGGKRPKKLHDEVVRKDDATEKKVEVEATSSDKSVGPQKRPAGRNSAKNSRPSQGFTDLMDRMYQETDLLAKRWEELQSLTSSPRLVKKIRDFYTTVDEQADKKRQELHATAGSSSASKKGTFKDLQGNLALTARKIYESAEGLPDEWKCRAAAEFVEEVLSKFKRTDVRVMIFSRRCLLSVEFASPKLQSDRETVMAAVQQDGLALQLASEKLQNTKEVVIAAVQNNGLALQFASEELQNDRDVVKAAVQQDGRACLFASEDAMVTAEKDGISHQFASDELNYDRHFNDVLQLPDVSPAIADFYYTLKAFIDANQTHLCQSTSLLELLDKSHKLQKVVALHLAMDKFVREGDVWLRELIKSGVDLNQGYWHPQHGSLTPLRHAVTLDSPAIIKLLCEEGADLRSKPSPIRYAHDLGSTANAAFAAFAQYPECFRAPDITAEIISRLANAGADINFADQLGRTALHFYAEEGHLEVVRALIENSARLDQRDSEGKTPLNLATEAGAPEEMVQLLYKSQKLQEALALHQAIKKASSDGVMELQELIGSRVDVSQEYQHPQHGSLTPLRHAVTLDSPAIIKLLCKEGADLCSKPSPIRYAHDLGSTANAAFAALAQYPECFRAPDITAEIIRRLANAGADINFADQLGRTALHFYAEEGHVEVVRALIENSARLDQRDSEGKTPLDLVTEDGAPEEFSKLLEYVELYIGLGGQPIALQTLILAEPPDVVSFLRHYVRDMKFKKRERVSYFAIQVSIGGDKVAESNTSWEALGKPKTIFVTLGGNFRGDRGSTKKFLKIAARPGADADYELRGHLEDFQDPDAVDEERGETAAYKAARNGDVDKLELLFLACANFDLRDRGGATALFIASQSGHLAAVRFLLNHQAQVDLALDTEATPLYVACQNGHLQVAEVLLAFGAKPNFQTNDKATPLFIAAQMGHYRIVQKLLEFNGDIKLANRTEATPLFIAAQNDHRDIVICLLLAGSDINARTSGGASPTYIAAQKGCMNVLPLLMEAPGVDANLSAKDGATPILIAAQNGHRGAVRFLLEKKVDVTKAMNSGATALFVAAQNGYLDVVQDLVAANPSLVNMCLQNGTSPLYVASQNGHLVVVEYLQQEGADTKKKSCGGASPFFIAAQNGHVTVVRFFLDVERKSPRPDIETLLTEQTDDKSAPLLVASQNGHLDLVQFLTNELKKLPITEERKKQLIDHQKNGGASALYLASQNGHESVVCHLIQLGASVNQALETKETPLFIASQGGHTRVVQHLLEARGDINQGKHDQTTPLYIASQNNHTDTFRLLLHARAEPNVQNANGATALFISSQKGHNDIVMELLDANADPKLPIQSGACPLYIAAMKDQVDVCRILLDCGRADPNQTPGHGTTALLISLRNGHEEVFDVLIEHPAVDVNKADLGGNIPLLTAIKVNMWLAVEKLISRCAKVDHGIFDDGIVILRGLANTLVSVAPAGSAKALQRSEIPPSGYPHADASAESLEQYREFFKKTSEEAETLLHQLHRVDKGLRNLANESLSPGTKQQVEQLRKLFHVSDPDKGSWTCGNLQVAALFQSVHNVLKASRDNDRLLDPGEAREELLMAGKEVLRACSLMRVYIHCAQNAFLPFLKRCSGHGCGTAEQDRMQQLITEQICSELQKASQLEGGLESLFKSMGTDFTTTPTKPVQLGTVDSGAKAMLESIKPGPGRPSVDTKSA